MSCYRSANIAYKLIVLHNSVTVPVFIKIENAVAAPMLWITGKYVQDVVYRQTTGRDGTNTLIRSAIREGREGDL